MRSSDFLFHLIKALSKGDRRNFKLFARLQEGDKKYIQLFDAIDKQEAYDEKKLLDQFKGERFTRQFSVAKNYLYNYILKTLHIFHKDQHSELSTLLHQVQILMGKNLFDQAHKMVRKAKHLAEKQERFQEMLYLLQHEREILVQTNKTAEFDLFVSYIQEEEKSYSDKIRNYIDYRHIRDRASQLLSKSKAARTSNDLTYFSEILDNPLIKEESGALSDRARILRLGTQSDCYWFSGKVEESIKITEDIISIYEQRPSLMHEDRLVYINQLSNLSGFNYRVGRIEDSLSSINKLKNLKVETAQEQVRIFEKYYFFALALSVETGDAEGGKELMSEIEKNFKKIDGKIRKSFELNLFYLSSYFWVQTSEPSKALRWINKILNEPKTEMRIDIQCMARILNLIIHLELDNKDLIEYFIKSTYRFLSKKDHLHNFERLTLRYFKKLSLCNSNFETIPVYKEFLSELNKVLSDPYEEKANDLFDLRTWIEAKIAGIRMSDLIRERKMISERSE